jgi:hypothetical protein
LSQSAGCSVRQSRLAKIDLPSVASPDSDSRVQLPELIEIERLVAEGGGHLDARVVAEASDEGRSFPLHLITMGTRDRDAPVLGLFGGVHGLERIGTQVVLSFLGSLVERMRWDGGLRQQLESLRLVFMPLVNPAGMWRRSRSNAQGVDLMRNAPVDAERGAAPLLGGQRISSRLPWYRGRAGAPMQVESEALCAVVEKQLLPAPFSLALDCHSGFGLRDRVWLPYAHTRQPIGHLAEAHALLELFDRSYPHHDYLFEPQSRQYLTHGDLWDHLYLRAQGEPSRMFLPLTLEMGSWRWVKKSPRQVFSRVGMFNPLPHHRMQRVLRRHLVWLEFLTRAVAAWRNWLPAGQERVRHDRAARDRWYSGA